MNRQEILYVVNSVLSEEVDTVPITEENFLYESNLDSLGYAIFWITLNTEFCKRCDMTEPVLSKDYLDTLNMNTYEVSELVDHIEIELARLC